MVPVSSRLVFRFEIDQLRSPTSAVAVQKPARHFSVHGAPYQLLSDNGSQFTSQYLKDFAVCWDFRHNQQPRIPSQTGWLNVLSGMPNKVRSR